MEQLPVSNMNFTTNSNAALLQAYHDSLMTQINQIRAELSQTETIKSEVALDIVNVLADALEKALVIAGVSVRRCDLNSAK
jgi:hypothetical protein